MCRHSRQSLLMSTKARDKSSHIGCARFPMCDSWVRDSCHISHVKLTCNFVLDKINVVSQVHFPRRQRLTVQDTTSVPPTHIL